MQMIQGARYLLNIDMLQIATWICEKKNLDEYPHFFCYHLSTDRGDQATGYYSFMNRPRSQHIAAYIFHYLHTGTTA